MPRKCCCKNNVQACYPVWCFYFFLSISWPSTVIVLDTADYVRLFTLYLWKSKHICLVFFVSMGQASQVLLRPTLVRDCVCVRNWDIRIACLWSRLFAQVNGPMATLYCYVCGIELSEHIHVVFVTFFTISAGLYLAEWMKTNSWKQCHILCCTGHHYDWQLMSI